LFSTDTKRCATNGESSQDAGRDEEDDVVGPLPDDLGVPHRPRGSTQHTELLPVDLVAVAVRAVQDVARPPLAKTAVVACVEIPQI